MTTTSKKLVPNIRFPEFEKSGEWVEKKIKDILNYEQPTNYIVKSDNYITHGIPVLTANKSFILGYTNETTGIYDNVPVIIFDDFTTDKKYITFPFKVKSSAIKILSTKKDYNIKFIYELMTLIPFNPQEHKRYYIGIYQNIDVLLPSLKEQQKIADFLSSVDELIELEQKKLEKLKEYEKGLLENLFPKENQKVPDLRFPEFENSGEWEEKKLDILFDFKNGYTPSKNNIAYWENGTIPWFRMEDIRVNGNILHDSIQHITEIAVKNNKLFPANSIILSISATIGEFALIKCDFICNQRFVCLSLKSNSCDIMYCYYYMNNISKWCKNNVHNNTFAAINIDELKKISILFPSVEEQQKIADFLSSVDELIIEQTTKLKLLCDYKKGLLQQLFPN